MMARATGVPYQELDTLALTRPLSREVFPRAAALMMGSTCEGRCAGQV
jgi:hypothetical protein